MKKIAFVLLTGCVGYGAYAQNSGNSADAAQSEIATANQSLYQAFMQEDAAAMDKMMTTDFVLINNDGSNVDRNTLIGAFRDGYVTIDQAEVEASTVRTYGDVAVVTGVWRMKGNVQGGPIDARNAFTTVYSRQNGNWQAVSSHLTQIK